MSRAAASPLRAQRELLARRHRPRAPRAPARGEPRGGRRLPRRRLYEPRQRLPPEKAPPRARGGGRREPVRRLRRLGKKRRHGAARAPSGPRCAARRKVGPLHLRGGGTLGGLHRDPRPRRGLRLRARALGLSRDRASPRPRTAERSRRARSERARHRAFAPRPRRDGGCDQRAPASGERCAFRKRRCSTPENTWRD